MTNTELKAPILQALNSLLRPLGYRKAAAVFSLRLPQLIHLVEVQSSKHSTAGSLQLTVNLGVFVPLLVYPDVRDFRKPSISLSHWRQRLGRVSPLNADHWWSVSSPDEAALVSAEVASLIAIYGLAALAPVSSMADLKNLWESGRSPGLTERQRLELLPRLKEALVEATAC